MTGFTPIEAVLGGSLIGVASVLLMAFEGRIAGITGILAGILPPFRSDRAWRWSFLCGAVTAPVLISLFTGVPTEFENPVSVQATIIGGLLVGVGVTYGSGCTSGHGVCGIALLSVRSVFAAITFMLFTFSTVFVVRHLIESI